MVKFASGLSEKTDYQIERKSVFWLVDFDLPMSVRESMGIEALRPILGEFLMGFYCDPLPGDTFRYKGHKWRVIGRDFEPVRYRGKDKRRVPTLKVEYLGMVPFNSAVDGCNVED